MTERPPCPDCSRLNDELVVSGRVYAAKMREFWQAQKADPDSSHAGLTAEIDALRRRAVSADAEFRRHRKTMHIWAFKPRAR